MRARGRVGVMRAARACADRVASWLSAGRRAYGVASALLWSAVPQDDEDDTEVLYDAPAQSGSVDGGRSRRVFGRATRKDSQDLSA